MKYFEASMQLVFTLILTLTIKTHTHTRLRMQHLALMGLSQGLGEQGKRTADRV